MVTFYSFCWSVIISSIFILILYFLRKRTFFLINFGVESLLLLFILCVIRMIIPFEFPVQKVINDPYIYATIMRPYVFFNKYHVYLFYVLIIIWLVGMCFFTYRLLKKLNESYSYLQSINKAYSSIGEEILSLLNHKKKLSIFQSSDIDVPFVAGLLHPTIYIPEYKYTKNQLYYIVLHEYIHYKNKDLWVKLFCNVFCIIFWWNPVVYLLPKDLNNILELKCDAILSRDFTDDEKIKYLNTLLETLRNMNKNISKKDIFFTSAFIHPHQENFTKQRFIYMLQSSNKATICSKITNIVSILLLCLFFIMSYYFILQPYYETPNSELWEAGTNDVINSSNSYLIQKDSETYELYCNGKIVAEISADEVTSGVCDYLPIKESERY